MKKFFSSLLALALISTHSYAFAAASVKADHFEITVKSGVRVGEAVDMTVKAVDKTGNAVKSYAGTIYVTVENDSKATVPYADEGYTFKNADQGVITFSKGLSFTKEGKMKVSVLDAEDDNLEGSTTVTVTAGTATATSSATTAETVTITNPTNNSEVPSGALKVTGTAKKNSKVQIFLNGKQAGATQTDASGNFLYEIKTLDQEQNVIQAKLLDGTNAIAGSSESISFKTGGTGGPAFKGLVIKEGNKVSASTVLNIEVTADPKLQEVSVSLGEDTQVLKEGATEGKYVGTITAPATAGSYPMGVVLKDSLGKVASNDAAETVEIADMPNPFKNIKSEVSDKKVTFTFELENAPKELVKFKFNYGTESGALTQESVTYEANKIRTQSGGYSWYIAGVDPLAKYFQISGLDASGALLANMKSSDVFEVEMGMAAASKCMVSNIAGVKIGNRKDATILSWDALPDASSYNVYKKGADGQYALLENVKTTSYTIHLDKSAVKFEDFAVKAVCGQNENESADFKEVTKVRTGPAQILFLLALSALVGYFVTRRKLAFFRGN